MENHQGTSGEVKHHDEVFVDEGAIIIGVSGATVRRLIRLRILPAKPTMRGMVMKRSACVKVAVARTKKGYAFRKRLEFTREEQFLVSPAQAQPSERPAVNAEPKQLDLGPCTFSSTLPVSGGDSKAQKLRRLALQLEDMGEDGLAGQVAVRALKLSNAG